MTRDASQLLVRPLDALATAAIMATTGVIEWANGRSPFCRCGIVRLWTGTVQGPENSQQLADWYSLSHLVHGLLFYGAAVVVLPQLRLGRRLICAVIVEAAWEIVENSPIIIDRYRSATIALGYSGDSILNSLGDIGFMVLGFLFASRAPTWVSVIAVLALELTSLAAIRDNLTLNILMLLHPIAGIKVWQAG